MQKSCCLKIRLHFSVALFASHRPPLFQARPLVAAHNSNHEAKSTEKKHLIAEKNMGDGGGGGDDD